MKQETDYRTKLRAIFLATLLVVSVVGMSVAFTGTVAATLNTSTDIDSLTTSDIVFDDDEASQAFRVVISGSDVQDGDSFPIQSTTLGAVDYSVGELSGFATGADAENVTSVDVSDGSILDVTINTNGDSVEDVVITVVAEDIDTEGLAPVEITDLDIDSEDVLANDISAVYDSNVVVMDDGIRAFSGKELMISDETEVVDTSATDDRQALSAALGAAIDGDTDADLRALNDDREVSSLVSELSITQSESGEWFIEVDTDGLSTGEYVVTIGDDAMESGTDVSSRDFDAGENAILVEVTEQRFDSAWEEDAYDDSDDDAELEFNTNRGNYNVEISADGLDYDDLENLFAHDENTVPRVSPQGDQPRFDQNADDDVITLDGSSDTIIADFSAAELDPGTYEFEISVTDSTASATASVEVSEEDVDGAFQPSVVQGAAGDVVEFTLELEDTDEAFIQIGDQDSNFADILWIEDGNDNGEVTFMVNTRTIGLNSLEGVDISKIYYSEDDDIEGSAIADDLGTGIHEELTFEDDDGNDIGDFNAYLDALGLGDDKDDQLTRPIQPTDYEVYADADGTFIVNDDDETEADNELDTAVLELQVPQLGDVITHVAPSEDANDADELSELLDIVTQREDIALDDRLIVQFEASGLYGQMVNQSSDDFSILTDGTGVEVIDASGTVDGIELVIEDEDVIGNQEPNEVDFTDAEDEDVFILIDQENEQFFVIVNTDSSDAFTQGTPDDGDSFEASLTYTTDDDNRFSYAEPETEVYPYLRAGEELTTSVEFDFEDREVSFNNLNADDEIQAENIEDSEISGETNIAPGSSAELRVASTDASSSFRMGESVDIESDGSIAAAFDFSGQEAGDEFDTRFRVGGSNVDTVDSVIVAEGDLGVEDPVEDDEDDVADDEDDVVDDDDGVVDDEEEDLDDDVEDVDDETPGFGALIALIALIGAALLAVRRQN